MHTHYNYTWINLLIVLKILADTVRPEGLTRIVTTICESFGCNVDVLNQWSIKNQSFTWKILLTCIGIDCSMKLSYSNMQKHMQWNRDNKLSCLCLIQAPPIYTIPFTVWFTSGPHSMHSHKSWPCRFSYILNFHHHITSMHALIRSNVNRHNHACMHSRAYHHHLFL